MNATEEELLTAEEVAREVRVGEETVRRWCAEGLLVGGQRVSLAGLGAFKAGQGWRVPRAALTAFLRAINGDSAIELASERKRRDAAAEAASKELDEVLKGPKRKR